MQFFSRLYRYTQSELKNNQENFLTEILCSCLNQDILFQRAFLRRLEILEDFQSFVATTQFRHDHGIPDIFITLDDSVSIIIECKISARKGKTQLERYAEILRDTGRKRLYLVYLTRSSEILDYSPESISLTPLLWHQVAALAHRSDHLITAELHNYLNELGMSNQMNFKLSQITVLKDYDDFVETAEHFLNKIKIRLKELGIKKIQKDKLVDDSYVGINFKYCDLPLWVGFFQFYPKYRETQFCISCEGVRKKATDYSIIAKGFGALHFERYDKDEEKSTIFHLNRDLSTFFDSEEFQTDKAIDFIFDQLSSIKAFMP